ncbi:MAG TPA: hypothetical protein V6D34_12985 [Candidatus Sericytochromatia bacterium]
MNYSQSAFKVSAAIALSPKNLCTQPLTTTADIWRTIALLATE